MLNVQGYLKTKSLSYLVCILRVSIKKKKEQIIQVSNAGRGRLSNYGLFLLNWLPIIFSKKHKPLLKFCNSFSLFLKKITVNGISMIEANIQKDMFSGLSVLQLDNKQNKRPQK